MISAEDKTKVAEAVREAEALTAGEIVVVLADRADRYRSIPFLWAFGAALIAPWPLILLTQMGPVRIFAFQLLIALVLSATSAIPRLHVAFVPGIIKRARAHEAAMRAFIDRGLTRTQGRTGILIYVAAAERYVEVVADIGISDQVDPSVWESLISKLIAAIRVGEAGNGLVQAVREAGAVLAEHAPRGQEDMDELSNSVVMMES